MSSIILPELFPNDSITDEAYAVLIGHATQFVPDNIYAEEVIALDRECANGTRRTILEQVHSKRHRTVSSSIIDVVRDLSRTTIAEDTDHSAHGFLLAPSSWTSMAPGGNRDLADLTMYWYLRFLFDQRSRLLVKNFGFQSGQRGLGIVSVRSDSVIVLGSQEIEGLVGILWTCGSIVDSRSLYEYRGIVYEMHGPASLLNASCRACANCAFVYKGNKKIAVVYTGVTILPHEEYLCAYGPGHSHLSCPKCRLSCN